MDWGRSVNCQNCLVLNKKLELFDLLKQKCCKNDDIARNLLLLKKSSEKSARLLENKIKKLSEARCRVTELEKSEETLKHKAVEYQLKLVAVDTRYQDIQKDVKIEREKYTALNQEKIQLLDSLETKENEIASLTLISKQTEEQYGIEVKDLKAKLEKSQELIKASGKGKRQTAALKKKYEKLVESLIEVFKDDVMDQGEPLKKLKKHVRRLKSKDDAAKLEAELNTPSLTPDGTTSSDTGIFSGDEDFGASSLTDDLQMSSDSSDDEFEDVQETPNITLVKPATIFAQERLPSIPKSSESAFCDPSPASCNTVNSNNSNSLQNLESSFSVDSANDADETMCPAFNDMSLDATETNSESYLSHNTAYPPFESSNEVSTIISESSCVLEKGVVEKISLFDPVDDSALILPDLYAPITDTGLLTKNPMQEPSDPSTEEPSVNSTGHEDTHFEDDGTPDSSAIDSMDKRGLISPVEIVVPLRDEGCIRDLESAICEENIDLSAPSLDLNIEAHPILTSPIKQSILKCDSPLIQSEESNGNQAPSGGMSSKNSNIALHPELTSPIKQSIVGDDAQLIHSEESNQSKELSDKRACSAATPVQTSGNDKIDVHSSHLESFKMPDPFIAYCTDGSKTVDSLEKGEIELYVPSKTGPLCTTSFVDHKNLSGGCNPTVTSEAIILPCEDVNDSRIFEEEDAEDRLSEQGSSSAETDLETMLHEWKSPTPVLPFSEDSCCYGDKSLDSQPAEPMDILSMPLFSGVTSVSSSHGNATHTDIQAISRKSPPHSMCKVSVGTNTDPPECVNVATSPISFISKTISSNVSYSDFSQQTENILTKVQMKSAFTDQELVSHERSVSPVRIHSKDMGVVTINELRRSVAVSPIRHAVISTATSPIHSFYKNRAVSPIRCSRRDAASSPVKSLFKNSAVSPMKVKKIDAETSPIKTEFDKGSPDSLENNAHFSRFTEVWHSASQENLSALTWSHEAQMLQGAVEMLRINTGDLAGVVVDESLVEELRHAMEIALRKACQGYNSPPPGLSTSVVKRKSFCLFDPCELEELCNQQHYNLHLLAKSKHLEKKMCFLDRPKKSSVKRLQNCHLKKKEKHLTIKEKSPKKTQCQKAGELLVTRNDESVANHSGNSFCTMDKGPENSISDCEVSPSFKAVGTPVSKSPVNPLKSVELPVSPKTLTVESRETNLSGKLQTNSCKSLENSEVLLVSSPSKVLGIERIRKSNCSGTIMKENTNKSPCSVNPVSLSKARDDASSIQTTTSSQGSPSSHLEVLSLRNVMSTPDPTVSEIQIHCGERIVPPLTPKCSKSTKNNGCIIGDSDARKNPTPRKEALSCMSIPDITVDLVIDTSCDSELDHSNQDISPGHQENDCDPSIEVDGLLSNDNGSIKSPLISCGSMNEASDTLEVVQENQFGLISTKPISRPRKRVSISSESSSTDSGSPDPGCVTVRRSSRAKKIRVVHDWDSGSKGSYDRGYMKFVKGATVFVSKEPDKAASQVQNQTLLSNPGHTDSLEAGGIDSSAAPPMEIDSHQGGLSKGNGAVPSSNLKTQELSEVHANEISQSKGHLSNLKSSAVKRSVQNESSHGTTPKRQKRPASKEIVEGESSRNDSIIPSENFATPARKSNLGGEASLVLSRQKVPNVEERIAHTSSSRTHALTNKPSKLQKLRSKVSRIHPLAQASKSPKSLDENDKMISIISSAENASDRCLKLPGTSHLSPDCVKPIQSEADIIEKFRGRECLRMAAASSGRTAQLIKPSEQALAKRRAAVERLSSLSSSGLQPQKRIPREVKFQPMVCPQDRIHAMESNTPVIKRSVKSGNCIDASASHEGSCKPSIHKDAGLKQAALMVQESLSSSEKTRVSFLINHNDDPRKTSLSPLAFIISEQQDCPSPSLNKQDLQCTEKVVADTLKTFVAAPRFTPNILQKAIDALSSPELYNISSVIVRDVVKMMDDDHDTPISKPKGALPSVPILTPVQQQLVTLVLQLSFQLQHLKLLPQQVLELLEYRIFRLGKAPEGDRILWCSRLHAAICRALCLRSRAFIFCWDSLYNFRGKSYSIIKTVLDVWPALFPVNPSFEKACPNAQVMLHFLRSHVEKPDGDHSWLKRLLNCAGVQTVSLNSSHLASKIFCSLVDGGDDTNLSALILLAKREDEQWTRKDLLSAKLLPAISRWSCKSLNDLAAERVIWTTCSILRALPAERNGDSASILIKLLRSELLRTESGSLSPHMQEVVAIGLAQLSRHDIENAAFSLLSWKPEHGSSLGFSSRLLHYLSFMIKSTARPMSWWENLLSWNNHSKSNLEEKKQTN